MIGWEWDFVSFVLQWKPQLILPLITAIDFSGWKPKCLKIWHPKQLCFERKVPLHRLFLTICKYSHLFGDGNLFSAFHFQSWILWILRSTVKPCIWLWDRVTAPRESRNLFWFRNSLGYMFPQILVYFSRIWWAYFSIFFRWVCSSLVSLNRPY